MESIIDLFEESIQRYKNNTLIWEKPEEKLTSLKRDIALNDIRVN